MTNKPPADPTSHAEVPSPADRVLALDCTVYMSGGKGRVEFDVDEFAVALGLTKEEATAWVARNL